MGESKSKMAKVRRLSEELALFRPSEGDGLRFLCPTCLEIFDNLAIDVSLAHIIPEAAGGKTKSLLCTTKCNNAFGKKQDRWLGDFLRYQNNPYKALEQQKYFNVNGERFQGAIEVPDNEEDSIKFIVDPKRNRPYTDLLLSQVLGRNEVWFSPFTGWAPPREISVEIPYPLTDRQQYISVGLLTAGYLAWFEALGYSWVLQRHLQKVRDQIRNPETQIILKSYIHACKESLTTIPVIGFVTVEGMVLPGFVFQEFLVMFPSFEHQEAYSSIPSDLTGKKSDFRPLFFPKDREAKIRSVSYLDHVLIRPDDLGMSVDRKRREHYLFLDNEPYRQDPCILDRVLSDDECAAIEKANEGRVLHLNIDLRSHDRLKTSE